MARGDIKVLPASRYFSQELPLDAAELTLGRLLDYCVERYAGRDALVFENRRFSYAELGAEVRCLARALLAAGATKGARVAVLFANRPEFVVSVFAIASVGGIAVPVSTFALADERDYILRHSDASVLLMQPQLLGRDFLGDLLERHPTIAAAPPGGIHDPQLPYLRRVVCIGEDPRAPLHWDDFLAEAASVPEDLLPSLAAQILPTDDGFIFYTSGSTGQPKGVLHLQRAPVFQGFRMATVNSFREGARSFTGYPVFWTGGFTEGLMAPLSAGATVILQESFDHEAALALIERERVTHMRMMLHDEARLASHPKARSVDLSSLESGLTTEPMRALVGVEGEVTEFTGYGMTETCTVVAALPFCAPIELRRSTHGEIIPGQQIRIVDPDTGVELPIGETGEIAVKGPSLMRAYYKVDPAETFDAKGFLRTSDFGHIDAEGYLHYDGRGSDIIKTSGANVSPIEIQERIFDWGRLEHAVVLGIPHPTRGQVIVLCAVRKEGDSVEEHEILDYLRGTLSSFKVPRLVLFFEVGEIDYTSSHKVKVPELRARAVERLLGSDIDADWKRHLRSQA